LTLILFYGVIGNEADFAVRQSNEQPGAGDGSDILVGSLRDVRDNGACFVWMLVDRRAFSEHEFSWIPFNFDGATGTGWVRSDGHCGEDYLRRIVEYSATDAATQKKRNKEMTKRDYLA
jgi:hypothetical protein